MNQIIKILNIRTTNSQIFAYSWSSSYPLLFHRISLFLMFLINQTHIAVPLCNLTMVGLCWVPLKSPGLVYTIPCHSLEYSSLKGRSLTFQYCSLNHFVANNTATIWIWFCFELCRIQSLQVARKFTRGAYMANVLLLRLARVISGNISDYFAVTLSNVKSLFRMKCANLFD